MGQDNSESVSRWNEETSRQFIDFGKFFVPEREEQFQIFVKLLMGMPQNFRIIDICCGEGLLEEIILESQPGAVVTGLDGSEEMLSRASARLKRFGNRFVPGKIELAEKSWRTIAEPVDAIISSLAIHHLEGLQKKELFQDIYKMVKDNGRIIVADILDPASGFGKSFAAESYDEIVRRRSIEIKGDEEAYNFFIREGWNIFRGLDPNDIDKPSPLFLQLKWLEYAGFREIDVNWMNAGHVIFSAIK